MKMGKDSVHRTARDGDYAGFVRGYACCPERSNIGYGPWLRRSGTFSLCVATAVVTSRIWRRARGDLNDPQRGKLNILSAASVLI